MSRESNQGIRRVEGKVDKRQNKKKLQQKVSVIASGKCFDRIISLIEALKFKEADQEWRNHYEYFNCYSFIHWKTYQEENRFHVFTIYLWLKLKLFFYFDIFGQKSRSMFKNAFLLSNQLHKICRKWGQQKYFGENSLGKSLKNLSPEQKEKQVKLQRKAEKNIREYLGWKQDGFLYENIQQYYSLVKEGMQAETTEEKKQYDGKVWWFQLEIKERLGQEEFNEYKKELTFIGKHFKPEKNINKFQFAAQKSFEIDNIEELKRVKCFWKRPYLFNGERESQLFPTNTQTFHIRTEREIIDNQDSIKQCFYAFLNKNGGGSIIFGSKNYFNTYYISAIAMNEEEKKSYKDVFLKILKEGLHPDIRLEECVKISFPHVVEQTERGYVFKGSTMIVRIVAPAFCDRLYYEIKTKHDDKKHREYVVWEENSIRKLTDQVEIDRRIRVRRRQFLFEEKKSDDEIRQTFSKRYVNFCDNFQDKGEQKQIKIPQKQIKILEEEKVSKKATSASAFVLKKGKIVDVRRFLNELGFECQIYQVDGEYLIYHDSELERIKQTLSDNEEFELKFTVEEVKQWMKLESDDDNLSKNLLALIEYQRIAQNIVKGSRLKLFQKRCFVKKPHKQEYFPQRAEYSLHFQTKSLAYQVMRKINRQSTTKIIFAEEPVQQEDQEKGTKIRVDEILVEKQRQYFS